MTASRSWNRLPASIRNMFQQGTEDAPVPLQLLRQLDLFSPVSFFQHHDSYYWLCKVPMQRVNVKHHFNQYIHRVIQKVAPLNVLEYFSVSLWKLKFSWCCCSTLSPVTTSFARLICENYITWTSSTTQFKQFSLVHHEIYKLFQLEIGFLALAAAYDKTPALPPNVIIQCI